MKQKVVILDTNVLLSDPQAYSFFDGYKIILPLSVIEEMDHLKSEHTEGGRNARVAVKILEKISTKGSLQDGVSFGRRDYQLFCQTEPQNDYTCTLQVVNDQDIIKQEKAGEKPGSNDVLNFKLVDNRLLAVCKHLADQGLNPTLITRDLNLRIKARALGLQSEDFDHCPVDNHDFRGWTQRFLDASEVKMLHDGNVDKFFDTSQLRINEFALASSKTDLNRYKLFRKLQDGMLEIDDQPDMWGFFAKNACQRMAIDLLLDDSIQLVYLMGPAGTGKTLLTILAGLHKVLTEKRYSRLFIARPLVSLGSDIGFIPGDLQEKLYHWMHPFYDNMEHLFNEVRMRGQAFDIPKENFFGVNVSELKKPTFYKSKYAIDEVKSSYDARVHENVGTLQHRGFLGIEAITHMRGRSLPRQFMFIDEAQNLTLPEVKTIITRVGQGAKLVLAGDPYQIDNPGLDFYNNGLVASAMKLRGHAFVGTAFLEMSERSPLARLAVEKL